jgi:hypothetical protein
MITNKAIASKYYKMIDEGYRPMQAYCDLSVQMSGTWTPNQAIQWWEIASRLTADIVSYPTQVLPDGGTHEN